MIFPKVEMMDEGAEKGDDFSLDFTPVPAFISAWKDRTREKRRSDDEQTNNDSNDEIDDYDFVEDILCKTTIKDSLEANAIRKRKEVGEAPASDSFFRIRDCAAPGEALGYSACIKKNNEVL